MTNPNPPPPDVGMERAVEAALDEWFNKDSEIVYWRSADLSNFYRAQMRRAIAAADSIRGRSPIDWRSDMGNAPRDRLIDILIGGKARLCDCYYDQIYDQWRTSRPSGHPIGVAAKTATHWMMAPLLPGEMAEMPDTFARTAMDGDRPRPAPFSTEVAKALDFLSDYIIGGEGMHVYRSEARSAFRLVDDHVRGKNHETPGAAVLAGGEIMSDPTSLLHKLAHYYWLTCLNGNDFAPKDAATLSGLQIGSTLTDAGSDARRLEWQRQEHYRLGDTA